MKKMNAGILTMEFKCLFQQINFVLMGTTYETGAY